MGPDGIVRSTWPDSPAAFFATDWSATAEYRNETNETPVRARLVTLDHKLGPYAQGQT